MSNCRIHKGFIPAALSLLIASGLIGTEKAVSGVIRMDRSTDKKAEGILAKTIVTRTSALWSNPQWQEIKKA